MPTEAVTVETKRGLYVTLVQLWRYRAFILGLVSRDFRSRYLNSVLGSLWSILNPLALIMVYSLVFSQVMRTRLPGVDDALGYSIYLCAGLFPWQYFQEVLQRCQNVFLEQANILKKVSFPRTSLPLYIFISSSINFGIIFALYLCFLAVVGKWPGWPVISVIPLLVLQQGFAVGLGVFLGTLHVFFRDTGHILGIVLQFWFWLTPIVYPAQVIPERLSWLLKFNPMTRVVQGHQNIFLYGVWPDFYRLIPVAVLAVTFMFLGYRTFIKLQKEMLDEL